ncbi:MAG: leucine-rich repeat domain-containing protein [archaeon]|nr:leucine-rich repeat domain-containing protein [archaeon]
MNTREQTLTFTPNNVFDQPFQKVPLIWLCYYDPTTPLSGTLDIPAVVEYNGKEYFVYGCFDGQDVWKYNSFFGSSCLSKMLAGSTVNIHVAYDHYMIPSAFFRDNTHIQSCSITYHSHEIDWEGTKYYSSGYVNWIGDLAFYKCSGIEHLNLPENINCMGYNCCSAISMEEFVFNTSVHSLQSIPAKSFGGYCFSGNPNLKTLYIGTNVDNLPNNLFTGGGTSKDGKEFCPGYSDGIVLVYNAGTQVTQDMIKKSVDSSNASKTHNVCIFHLCGGTIEEYAEITYKEITTDTGVKISVIDEITMPIAYIPTESEKVYIPAWGGPNSAKVLSGTSYTITANKGVSVFW